MASGRSAEELSLAERRLLAALGKLGGEASLQELSDTAGAKGPAQLMNALNWLKAKGYVRIEERVVRQYALMKNAPSELPERRLLELLARRPMKSTELMEETGEKDRTGIGIGWLKRKGWVETDTEGRLSLTPDGRMALTVKDEEEELLERLRKGEVAEDDQNQGVLRQLHTRKEFVEMHEKIVRTVHLLEKGRQALEAVTPSGGKLIPPDLIEGGGIEEISQITPELLRSGKWRNARLRPYNMESPVPLMTGARMHPVVRTIRDVSRIFVSMGFSEIEDDYVQSAFWDMDVLFTPQDHPAREMQDTFYLKQPPTVDIEGTLARKVGKVQESGGNTGSTGWGGKWSEEEARQALLRTHTTVATIKHLYNHKEPPVKAFTVGRIFRHEAMDATHLSEFHQIEGVIMEKGASLDMLFGVLKEFYRRMGIENIRARPGYFPYTEPSMEIDIEYNGKWIEMGGSGMFRPEVLKPLGIHYPVLAWGLGLERLVMLRYGYTDIRELYLTDISKLRKMPLF
ncbi:MAG: phenylalanine--tRNA ligase subunit alpha [Methanomassiliicoccales archaeon]